MNKKMTIFTFNVTLDGWKLTAFESKGKDAETAKRKLKKRFGRRITDVKLLRWFNPNISPPATW